MRARAVLSSAAVGLAMLLLSACGTTSGGPAVSQVGATTPPAPSPPPPPPPGREAKSVVTAYYASVNSGRFGAAWSHLSPELRRVHGGFYDWRAGYDATTATTLLYVRTVSATPTSAIDRIRLIGDAIDACGNDVSQTFAGTWTLENRGGTFVGVALDVSQVAGDELITDPEACAPPPSTSVDPPAPSDAGCDPNYV